MASGQQIEYTHVQFADGNSTNVLFQKLAQFPKAQEFGGERSITPVNRTVNELGGVPLQLVHGYGLQQHTGSIATVPDGTNRTVPDG